MSKLGKVAVALAVVFSVGAAGADPVVNVPAGATAADINAAIQAVDEGGTVNLAAVTYTIDASILLNRGVTLKGAGRDATTLDGNGGKFRGVTLSNADAVLADLTVTKCAGIDVNTSGGGGIIMSAGTVVNCHITANSLLRLGSFGAGIYMTGGKVLNCVIDKNKSNAGGGADHSGGGIYMTAGVVEGCLIVNNEAAKAEANYNTTYGLTTTYGGGVYMKGASKLINCTVYGNYARRNGGGVYVSGTTAQIVNCVIAGNDIDWKTNAFDHDLGPAAATNYLDHCLVGGAPAEHAPAMGVLAALTDPANGVYTLSDVSPAIGAGRADVALERTNDLVGNPRVHDGVADIGCLARTAVTPTCGIGSDRRVALVGKSVTLTALRMNGASGDAVWTVTAPDGSVSEASGDEAELAFDQVGSYSVRLDIGSIFAERDDFVSAPLTNYVNGAATAAVAPYDTPEKAAKSIKAAVAAATDGSTIVVTGTVTEAGIVIHQDIAVVGYGADCSVVNGNQSGRIFSINSRDARIEGLKLRNGKLTSGLYNQGGTAVRIGYRGGTVTQCTICDNQPSAGTYYSCGGGVLMMGADSRVDHCIICNNQSIRDNGGGVMICNGILENCLIYGNTAKTIAQGAFGGGVAVGGTSAKVRNCTIVANTCSDKNGGGVYFTGTPAAGQIVNCMIVENIADSQTFALGKPDWAMATDNAANRTAASNSFVNCAFEACAAIGEGSVSVAAPFVNALARDYHVLGSAASVEAGIEYEGMSETDLDGKPRVSGEAPDIGCYEVDKNVFAPTFDVAPTVVMAGSSVTLTPDLDGAPDGVALACRWTFTNGAGYSFVREGQEIATVVDHGGIYTIRLDVLKSGTEEVIATYPREDVLTVGVLTNYVTSVASASAREPYDTPETAHTNLNALLDRYVIDGSTVVLDGGVHYIGKTLALTKKLTISGAGQDKTFVKRSSSFDNTTRTLYVNHEDAVVEKMAFVGATNANHSDMYNCWGPICDIGANGGTVRHCTVSNNTINVLYSYGIGIACESSKGLISHCLIADNRKAFNHHTESRGSAAVSGGRIDNCVVRNNRVDGAAGIFASGGARVYNCTVTSNVSTNYDNTTVLPNTSGYVSSANGICVSSPTAGKLIVRNCIFADNVGKDGTYAPEAGGVTAGSAYVQNSLFKFDDPAVSVGTKCVNGDPMFVDAAAHDYHVRGRSPAKKKGVIESWMRDDACFETDFGGDPRLVQPYHMDMGAYETDPIGFKLLVR